MNYTKLQADIIKAAAARDGYKHKTFPYQFGYFHGDLVVVYDGIVGFFIPAEHLYIDICRFIRRMGFSQSCAIRREI